MRFNFPSIDFERVLLIDPDTFLNYIFTHRPAFDTSEELQRRADPDSYDKKKFERDYSALVKTMQELETATEKRENTWTKIITVVNDDGENIYGDLVDRDRLERIAQQKADFYQQKEEVKVRLRAKRQDGIDKQYLKA